MGLYRDYLRLWSFMRSMRGVERMHRAREEQVRARLEADEVKARLARVEEVRHQFETGVTGFGTPEEIARVRAMPPYAPPRRILEQVEREFAAEEQARRAKGRGRGRGIGR